MMSELLGSPVVIFLIQVTLFSLPPLYIATLRWSQRITAMYVYAGIVLVLGGFLGAVYAIPLTESITVSGGNLAYGALMYTTILLFIVEGNLLAIRNVIRLVITVNVFKFALFSSLSWLLSLEILVNPFETMPDLFGVSAKFMIIGGALIIFELLLLLFLFEKIKSRVKNIYLLSFLYTICFVGVLCLDGVLFPLLAFGFDAALVGIVVGDVTGKLVMALAYSLPIMAFLLAFRNRLTTYLETPIYLGHLLTASREKLLKEIAQQQKSLETERQQHKSKLLETTQLMKKTFASLNEAVFVVDPAERRIVACNPAVERVFGYTPAELIGQPTAVLYNSQEDFAQFGALGEPSLTRTGKFETEYTMRHKDGRLLITNHVVTSLGDQTDWQKGVVSVVRDVTERKAAEAALQQSETRYRSLFEYSPVAQWEEDFSQVKNAVDQLFAEGITDLEAYLKQDEEMLYSLIGKVKVLNVNQQTVELYGVESKDSFLGRLKIGHPSLVRSFITQVVAIAQGTIALTFASQAYKANGELMHIIFYWSVLPGYEQDYSRVIVSIVDITAVVKAEHALEDSRRRLQALFDHSQDAILLADDQGNYVDVNPAACGLTGYSRQELLQMAVWDITPETQEAEGREIWQQFIAAGKSEGEYILQAKDGRLIDIEFRAVSNIAPGLHLSMLRDITLRKQAEIALKASEQKYRDLVETSHDLIWAIDAEGRITFMNQAARHIYGREPQEMIGNLYTDFIPPEQAIVNATTWQLAIEKGDRIINFENWVFNKDGKKVLLSANAILLRDTQGNVIGSMGTSQDITARKKAQKQLEAYAQRLEILQKIDRAILVQDSPERIAQVVIDHLAQLIESDRISAGWFTDDGKSAIVLATHVKGTTRLGSGVRVPIFDHDQIQANMRQGKTISVGDLRQFSGLSSSTDALIEEGLRSYMMVPLIANGKLIGYLSLGSKQTERFDASHEGVVREVADQLAVAFQQANLREAEQAQRILAETLQQTAVTLVGSLNLEETLNTILTQLGLVVQYDLAQVLLIQGELLVVGARREALVTEKMADEERLYTKIPLLNRALESGKTVLLTADQIEQNYRDLPGTDPVLNVWVGIPLIARDVAVGFLTVGKVDPALHPEAVSAINAFAQQAALAIEKATILSELEKSVQSLRETQGQMVRAARLSAIGETAAGVAHQINNPLTTVIVDSHLLLKNLPASHPAHNSAAAIHHAALRAASVVERLLDFSLTKPTTREPVDISHSIYESVTLLKSQLPENVRLQLDLEADLPLVEASPAHLQDVWLNLLLNARDAVKEMAHGIIKLTARHNQRHNTIEVAIQDNGTGIPLNEQRQIFTPFYSTKVQGTGLGLAVCQDIVMHHGGEIRMSSTEAEGTKFTVILPLQPDDLNEEG